MSELSIAKTDTFIL